MIHIAITAGGTEEQIDGIRRITNMSSGSLGWHCLEEVFRYMEQQDRTDFRIHHIKAPKAISKKLSVRQRSHLNFIDVTDTQSVYDTINKLMDGVNIDVFIHSMAISDFAYSYSASIINLAKELHQIFEEDNNISEDDIAAILMNPRSKYNQEDKISSKEEIVMGFKTTPKVISLIKKKNRDTFLVGFKLVKGGGKDILIKEAEKLRITNQCDAVFANESSKLSEENHTGILLHNGEIVAEPVNKKQIAESIVNLAMAETLKREIK